MSRRCGELDEAGRIEEDDAIGLGLIRARESLERRLEKAAGSRLVRETREVRLQEIEDEAVTLGEIVVPGSVEEERLGVPEG